MPAIHSTAYRRGLTVQGILVQLQRSVCGTRPLQIFGPVQSTGAEVKINSFQ